MATGTDADLTNWKPGQPAPDEDAYRRLTLDSATLVDEISDHMVADLGQILADAAAAGLPTFRTQDKIAQFLGDKARGHRVATTELTRAQSAAAAAHYQTLGITRVLWLAEPGACPVCQGNTDQGSVPLGAPFESGDPYPPAHPNCRCMPGVERPARATG